jgi:cellulose synthase operon protein YhjQ
VGLSFPDNAFEAGPVNTPKPEGGSFKPAPAKPAGDDVIALCSQSGLSVDDYQSFGPFPGATLSRPRPTADLRTPAAAKPAPPTLAPPILAPPTLERAPLALARAPIEMPAAARRPMHALRAILREPESAARPREAGDIAARLPVGSLSVVSCGGGVGTTTILATLGRIFARRRERVLLLDGECQSVLPFYFGADIPASGAWLLHERHSAAEQSIRVIARRRDLVRPQDGNPESGREPDESLLSGVATHLGNIDRVLVDAWSEMSAAVQQRLLSETNTLVVLAPDLRCLVRMRTLLQFFDDHRRRSGHQVTPHFLISQFDSGLPLHQELRRCLSAELGDRLLDFTLRRSDEIPMSLAEGSTIADYAPDSEVAGDFIQLADWVTMWQGTQNERDSRQLRV